MKGVAVISNTMAIEIEIISDEVLKYKYSTEDEWHEAAITYEEDTDGEIKGGFVTDSEVQWFLDEFMRVD